MIWSKKLVRPNLGAGKSSLNPSLPCVRLRTLPKTRQKTVLKVASLLFVEVTIPTNIYVANCKLFWECLRYAVAISSSDTCFLSMQLRLPYLSRGSFQYAFAAFKI